MSLIIRILGLLCVLGGIVLLNLDLMYDGNFFLNFAMAYAVAGGFPAWFGLILWIMPIYVGLILLIGASLDNSIENRRQRPPY